MSEANESSSPAGPRGALSASAELVGYAGLAPLIACFAGMALLPEVQQRYLAQRIAIAWGGALLAFVGAVHWGLALAGRLAWTPRRILGAVLPALAGAAAWLLGGQRAFALLVVGFGLFWLYEHRSVGVELPPAYLRLRRNSSLAICAVLALLMILSDTVGLD